MDNLNRYTSTGNKLIFHPDVIKDIQVNKRGTPLSLQIAPTSICNLNCDFCSNSKRVKHESLDIEKLTEFLRVFSGTAKVCEWTGGGDPTLYSDINEAMFSAYCLGYAQGFITNGLDFSGIFETSFSFLNWIRISLNGLDYGKKAVNPRDLGFRGTLGFSYVWNEKSFIETMHEIRNICKSYGGSYVRIVPNCIATLEEQEENNKMVADIVKHLGEPFFFQAKTFKQPDKCYWYAFKPFILHDGGIYRCSSVVLNSGANRTFHNKYRICKMEDFYEITQQELKGFDTENCTHCVFYPQNEMIKDLLKPDEMVNFI